MRMLFDLYSAQPGSEGSKFHGGGEYVKRIFKCLIEEFPDVADIEVFFNQDAFLDDWILELIKKNNIKTIDVKQKAGIQELLDQRNYDVFYSGIPYDFNYLRFPQKTVSIGTIHGLRSLEKLTDKYAIKYESGKKKLDVIKSLLFPKIRMKHAKDYFEKGIKKFDKLICVSNHTRYAVKSFFPDTDISKFAVYYTPAKYVGEIDYNAYEDVINGLGKYILLIGLNRWIKNGYRALLALDSVFQDDLLPEYKVVLIGGLPENIKKSIKCKNKFVLLSYVETDLLENLYKYCDVFLYPTLNEGFGMPPLEAMRYGRTCVVSAVCSVPEICGDAVYYVNPYDINEIRNRVIMATEKKIDEEKISAQYKKIVNRQETDLRDACKYILGI